MSNPILNDSRWNQLADAERDATLMTVQGAVNKSFILVGILLATMFIMWTTFWTGQKSFNPGSVMPFMIAGAIGGLVLCLITMFTVRFAAFTSIAYAICEGLFLGGITMIFQARFPGLPFLAAACTTGTLLGMLILYRTGIIRATEGFMRGVMVATAGVFVALALVMLLSLFGIDGGIYGALRGNGPIAIGFSVFMIALAALNLVVDFGIIEQGAQRGAPKHMEWIAAFGLLVTLVWLYLEFLRLLSKFRK